MLHLENNTLSKLPFVLLAPDYHYFYIFLLYNTGAVALQCISLYSYTI
jgi:hypothetical protein